MVRTQNGTQIPVSGKPFIIHKEVFLALGPLEQLAARALEKCGKVQIVDNDELMIGG
jgi:hypothetical protein